jgi:hypothetical protein
LFSGPDSALEARGEGARGDAIKTEIEMKTANFIKKQQANLKKSTQLGESSNV